MTIARRKGTEWYVGTINKYDGWPWESIKFGVLGFTHLKQTKRYFDEAKRKTLA